MHFTPTLHNLSNSFRFAINSHSAHKYCKQTNSVLINSLDACFGVFLAPNQSRAGRLAANDEMKFDYFPNRFVLRKQFACFVKRVRSFHLALSDALSTAGTTRAYRVLLFRDDGIPKQVNNICISLYNLYSNEKGKELFIAFY